MTNHRFRGGWIAPSACGSALALTSSFASGALLTNWTAARGGLYADPLNWSLGVPGTADTAAFGLEAAYDVAFAAPANAGRGLFHGGAVTLQLGGQSWTLSSATAFSPGLVVGETTGDDASLALEAGAVNASFASVGFEPGSMGSMSIGSDAMLDVLFMLSIGQRGTGSLYIDHGAAGAFGAHIGDLDTAIGTVVVSGSDSALDIDTDLIVGFAGVGTLVIQDGAVVTADQVVVALQTYAVGDIIVDGDGSQLVLSGSLDIGFDAMGSLTILNGGRVETGSFATVGTLPVSFIPEDPPPAGDGALTVLGPGSLLLLGGDLHCPFLGQANLVVGDGGRVFADGSGLWLRAANTTVTLVLSSADESADALIGVADVLDFADGELQVVEVELARHYQPTGGEHYTLFAGAVLDQGEAPELVLPALSAGLSWQEVVDEQQGSITIAVSVKIDADYNGDGIVNGADLGILLSLWGGSKGDLDGDGVVNGSDLGILLGFWTA